MVCIYIILYRIQNFIIFERFQVKKKTRNERNFCDRNKKLRTRVFEFFVTIKLGREALQNINFLLQNIRNINQMRFRSRPPLLNDNVGTPLHCLQQ